MIKGFKSFREFVDYREGASIGAGGAGAGAAVAGSGITGVAVNPKMINKMRQIVKPKDPTAAGKLNRILTKKTQNPNDSMEDLTTAVDLEDGINK